MDAKQKQGMAILEEFLQEKYVENFDSISEQEVKVKGLRDSCPKYFYDPAEDDYGVEHYVTDSKGHALYLIKKQNLPNEIKESLVGGDAGEGKYSDYASLNDVYGVTFDLKVWYSSGNGELYGITEEDLDLDDLRRTVLKKDSDIAKLVSKREDGTVTANDVQEIKRLTINDTVKSLKDLYALTSLEELTLEGVELDSLDGIENATSLNYVFFKSCKIGNYSSLKNLGKKLKYLYFYDIDDKELDTVCTNIQDGNFEKLEYMAVVGKVDLVNDSKNSVTGLPTAKKTITNLLPFSKLKGNVVGRVKYLSLQSNSISDTENDDGTKILALENISEFKDLYLLRIERNNLTSLKGLENMTDLTYLYCTYNNLGANEVYKPLGGETDKEKGKDEINDSLASLRNKAKLFYLHLQGNLNLKWVGYLKNDTNLRYLYFGDGTVNTDCINMVDSDVGELRSILKLCGQNKSCPGKYWISLLDSKAPELEVNLNGQTITLSQFNQLGTYTNIKYLDLKDIKIKTSDTDENLIDSSETNINSVVNNVLKNITNLKYLRLCSNSSSSLRNLSEITFVKGKDGIKGNDDINLVELDAIGTSLSTRKLNGDGTTSTYENGVILLNDFCSDLRVLMFSGEYTILSDLNNCLKRTLSYSQKSWFYPENTSTLYGLNETSLATLDECEGLTSIGLRGFAPATRIDWDFSNLEGLKSFSCSWFCQNFSLKFPDSCNSIVFDVFQGSCNLSNLSSFNLSTHSTGRAELKKILKSVSKDSIISSLDFRFGNGFGYTAKDFDLFKELYDEMGYKLNIKKLVGSDNLRAAESLTSLKGIEYINDLEILSLVDGKFPNLSDISSLIAHKNTLKSLTFSNCSISKLGIFKEFTKLTEVDLQNNSISDYYTDEETGETIYNIRVICDAVIRGCQNEATVTGKTVTGTLKLKGNDGVTDWSPYLSGTWSSSSNYGRKDT